MVLKTFYKTFNLLVKKLRIIKNLKNSYVSYQNKPKTMKGSIRLFQIYLMYNLFFNFCPKIFWQKSSFQQ
ncbi:hypothetical protein EGI24_07255 [Lacihabitans sp. CS3-21]|nr:hypothetical protein [Lacihabitans sp. CS3-21]